MGVAALPYVTAAIAAYGAYTAHEAAGNVPKAPEIKPPPAPTQQPDQAQARKAGQALAGGPSTGFLSGAGGVPNSSLNLGFNTLLGR